MRIRALLLIAAAGLLVAAAPGGDDAKKMQGTWDIVAYEVQGKPLPAAAYKKVKVVFAADKMKIDNGTPNAKDAPYTIDAAKKPRHIDVTSDEAGGKLKLRGIYEFDGETLKICLAAEPAERPAAFKTSTDTKSLRMVLKKAK